MYDDDENEFDDNGSDNGIAQLRKAYKVLEKQNKELATTLESANKTVAEMTGKVNATTVA